MPNVWGVIGQPLFSLKGWHKKAQGSARGRRSSTLDLFSLKGWHKKAQGNALGPRRPPGTQP